MSRIRGPEGTEVVLELHRPGTGEIFVRALERREIEIPTVTLEVLEGGIGHLILADFNSRATAQLRDQLRAAQQAGVTALILDLRNNPGGFLDQAVSVSDEFLDEGTIVVGGAAGAGGLSRPGWWPGHRDPAGGARERGSASASEIVTGAVQAHERTVIRTSPSARVGAVRLRPERWLADPVTTALWYTPDDRQIQGEGLVPDIVVADDPETEADEQLEAAVSFLKERTD